LQYAVLFGVALAVLLFVARQSNQVTLKEWVLEEGKLPHEQPAPEVLPSRKATVLMPYGSLFFAAAPVFEDQLPQLEEDTRHAVALVSLSGRQTVGSTLLDVLQRYGEDLRDHDSKLMLVAVHPDVKAQLELTGQIDRLGEDNVFVRTADVGESVVVAYNQADQWIAEVTRGDPDVGPDAITKGGLIDAASEATAEEVGEEREDSD
jgi:SulP family sulfate permease